MSHEPEDLFFRVNYPDGTWAYLDQSLLARFRRWYWRAFWRKMP